MGLIMFNGIILTVILAGKIGGLTKHVDLQEVAVDCTPLKSQSKLIMRTTIAHSNRVDNKCTRKELITGEVVTGWVRGESPYWEKKFIWKSMNNKQKLQSYLRRSDEGFGFTYEEL